MFCYFGDNIPRNRNEVVIVFNKETERTVKRFKPVTDRIALLKLNARPCNINIIAAYAQTSKSTEEEMERFYNDSGITLT